MVRAKWKSLRDSFRKELKKMPVKRSGDGASESTWKSSWQYFESLYFLKDQFTARETSSNLPIDGNDNVVIDDTNSQFPESDTQDLDESINNANDLTSVANILPETRSESNASTSARTDPLRDKNSERGPSKIANKRLKKKENDDVGAALIRIEENKLKIMENEQKKILDEDECFFQSLLPHIRTLTPQQKMSLRIKMQELVYNFVYRPQPNQFEETLGAPTAQVKYPQFVEFQNVNQAYSNPPSSAASYLSNFSEENN